jgi:hypothetical protein
VYRFARNMKKKMLRNKNTADSTGKRMTYNNYILTEPDILNTIN